MEMMCCGGTALCEEVAEAARGGETRGAVERQRLAQIQLIFCATARTYCAELN